MAVFSAGAANKAKRAQRGAQRRLDAAKAKRDRTEVINPYDQVSDLSNMIYNPMANLQVATGAAEFQAEQADISLANTLDTLRATGAGAGGATALAQAALQSKRGIANTIQQQEAQNAQLRAQGAQAAMNARIAEQQRLQQANILGRTFKFQGEESRRIADMSRESAMVQQYAQQRADALGAMGANTGAVLGGAASGAAAALVASDKRLKHDIEFLRLSPSGLKIYSFKYKNQEGVYEGVMSDEVPANAVVKNLIGIYDGVDYSKIDVEFKRIK